MFPGEYLCVANNGVGEETSHTVTLEVEFTPLVEAPRPRIAQAAEYDAVLTCKVTAFPRPTIHWNLDGGESITNDDNYEVSHFSESNDVTLTTLKVKTVSSTTNCFHGKILVTVKLWYCMNETFESTINVL